MKIEIRKTTAYQLEYILTRADRSVEQIALETKTYFFHDICHYVLEKNLSYSQGFWGMLSQGYAFKELFGKENALTTDLRFIEQIVGPVQSAYQGYIQQQNFNLFVAHIGFKMPEGMLDVCLTEIASIIKSWEHLPVGQSLMLEWPHKEEQSGSVY